MFGPLWRHLIVHFYEKVSHKLLGKPVSIWPGHPHNEYPLPAWKSGWLRWAVEENLITPKKMRSALCITLPRSSEIVEPELAGNHQTGEFLDRVITVKMALSTIGASVDF